MTQAKRTRNQDVRRRRGAGYSQRALARRFNVSRWRITQILDETGGDPLRDALLARMSMTELERDRDRLVDRIGADLRRLIVVEEEMEVRRTDRLVGLAG